MADVPVATKPLQLAVFEVKVEMIRRPPTMRAYVLLFFPHGAATLAISRENFSALRQQGVPLITAAQARGVVVPKEVGR